MGVTVLGIGLVLSESEMSYNVILGNCGPSGERILKQKGLATNSEKAHKLSFLYFPRLPFNCDHSVSTF